MRATIEGQRLADFLNTEDHRRPDRREPPYAPDDELTSPASLSRWMGAPSVGSVPDATAADLARARRLRATLRDVVAATGRQLPPKPSVPRPGHSRWSWTWTIRACPASLRRAAACGARSPVS